LRRDFQGAGVPGFRPCAVGLPPATSCPHPGEPGRPGRLGPAASRSRPLREAMAHALWACWISQLARRSGVVRARRPVAFRATAAADRIRRATVALCSGTIALADPGRNAVTARHHSDGEGKEHEKEERQEQGDHVVPASLLLSLMRPQVCLTAHCVPFRNGKRAGGQRREPAATPVRHLGTMVPFRGPQHNPAPSERAASSALRGATGAAADAGQRLAGQLQRVVEPLPLGAVVLRVGLLAQGLKGGANGGGALGGQVAADNAGVERGSEAQGAVVWVGVVGVGLLRPPGLDRAGGDGGQVIKRRPGRGRASFRITARSAPCRLRRGSDGGARGHGERR
jgi:hypothetical protein